MLRRVALVRTDVSEELSAFFITATRIDELGTTLDVTSNRRTSNHSAHIHKHIVLNYALRHEDVWGEWMYRSTFS
jgi:hypothetical protein